MSIAKTKIEWVSCHRKPERSFFWKGRQFPVCARCTGIHIGYLTFPIFTFGLLWINVWWTLALMLPTILDGLSQAYLDRESTNWLRLTTGIAAGIGAMSLVAIVGKNIGLYIISIIN
jgi:uncharacterized membrane protein